MPTVFVRLQPIMLACSSVHYWHVCNVHWEVLGGSETDGLTDTQYRAPHVTTTDVFISSMNSSLMAGRTGRVGLAMARPTFREIAPPPFLC